MSNLPKMKYYMSWSPIARRRQGVGRLRVATADPSLSEDFADDYYAVLGLVIYIHISFSPFCWGSLVLKIITCETFCYGYVCDC
mgnify:CR=1 FL=1